VRTSSHNRKVNYPLYKNRSLITVLINLNPVHTIAFCFPKICVSVILQNISSGLCFSFRLSNQNCIRDSYLSVRFTFPASLILFLFGEFRILAENKVRLIILIACFLFPRKKSCPLYRTKYSDELQHAVEVTLNATTVDTALQARRTFSEPF
jgi:hypothetical protein